MLVSHKMGRGGGREGEGEAYSESHRIATSKLGYSHVDKGDEPFYQITVRMNSSKNWKKYLQPNIS